MSIVLITNHNEKIYDILKTQEQVKKFFKPKAKAVQSESVAAGPEVSEPVKKKIGVMGVAEMEPPDPHNFLKKHTGQPCYVKDHGPKPPKLAIPKKVAEVPKTKDLLNEYKPPIADRNFVVENMKRIKKTPPKEPVPKVVLDRLGNKQPLSAALEPVYVHVPHFGKTPLYLKRFIAQREREYQLKKDDKVKGVDKPLCEYITRDRREALLQGLKQNWEELQLQYQGLPILTDTIPKIIRKSKLEKELKQLESDIVLLERHPYIYVYEENHL